ESDAFGAKRTGMHGVARQIGVGAHAHAAVGLGQGHKADQLGIVGRGRNGAYAAFDHFSRVPVERGPAAAAKRRSAHVHLIFFFTDVDLSSAADAAFSQSASDHGGVAGHTAASGQDAGSDFHACDVFGSSLGAH